MNNKIALEVQLLGWKKSTSKQPPTVTIALQSDEDMEFFETLTVAKGKTAGQIMSAAFILSPDDSQHGTIEPKKEMAKAEANKVERCPQAVEYHKKHSSQWPSNTANALCAQPNFYLFLMTNEVSPLSDSYEDVDDVLKMGCCIKSKSELDTNPDALKIFLNMLADYRKFVQGDL